MLKEATETSARGTIKTETTVECSAWVLTQFRLNVTRLPGATAIISTGVSAADMRLAKMLMCQSSRLIEEKGFGGQARYRAFGFRHRVGYGVNCRCALCGDGEHRLIPAL